MNGGCPCCGSGRSTVDPDGLRICEGCGAEFRELFVCSDPEGDWIAEMGEEDFEKWAVVKPEESRMIYDGDHTPEEFDKARRMEDEAVIEYDYADDADRDRLSFYNDGAEDSAAVPLPLAASLEIAMEALRRIASGNFIRKDAYVIAREALAAVVKPEEHQR